LQTTTVHRPRRKSNIKPTQWKQEKKSRLRRVLEAVFSTDTVYITVYIIIMCACRRWVNSRARKGDFFTQKGLNLMAGQIDTEILFIVSFIKSLFMRHVRECACRRLICVNTHPRHPYYPPPKNKLIRVRECRHGCKEITHMCVWRDILTRL